MRKELLLCSASMLAIATLGGAAYAQETMETVVVTGIRASLTSAQSIKQNADQVVDSITAVDIGALPDRSVAEALQRVPGVQLTRTDALRDPVRYGGTGNGVFIRGLSWVQALTNGRDTFSAANGRTLSFADVSADLMSGVDVYKNPNAKMIEGGVGGTVDLKTRKPFDQDGRVIAVSADATYATLQDSLTPSVNLLLSDRWQTGIGEIGVLFSADYQSQKNRTEGFQSDAFTVNAVDPATGATVHLPDSSSAPIGWRQIDWTQNRTALDLSVQWRPNEKWELTLTGIYSKAEPHEAETGGGFQMPTSVSPGWKFASDGTWLSGTLPNAQMTMGNDTRVGSHHNTNADYSLNAKYTPTDALTITADMQYAESRAAMRSMSVYNNIKNNSWVYFDSTWSGTQTVFPNAPVLNPAFDYSGATPKFSLTSSEISALANPANTVYGAAMDHLENNFAHVWSGRLDASYDFGGAGLLGWIKTASAGYRSEFKQAVTRQTGWNWHELSYQWWFEWCGCDLPSRVVAANGGGTALQSAMHLTSFDPIFGNNIPSLWLLRPDVLAGDTRQANTLLQPANTNGSWTALAAQNHCTGTDYKCMAVYQSFTPQTDNVNGGINNQKEDTYAGYFMLDFAHDTLLGLEVPVDGNVGVRVVQTKDTISGGSLLIPSVTACAASPIPDPTCTDRDRFAVWSAGGGNVRLAGASNSYTDVLPSFNFRAHLSDQIQARLAYSQAIVRPDISYTQNFESLSVTFSPAGPISLLGGTGGNPGLKPMHAQQYDLSLEYYFSNTGNVSLALFHKDLSGYFMAGTMPYTLTRNGITYTFNVTSTVNGGKGKVEGFELSYQQFFDSLPGAWSGLGVQANYTKIYNSGGANAAVNIFDPNQVNNSSAANRLPMEGMSNDSFNFTLLYSKYGIDGRLAYNWRSRYLMTSSAANVNQPIWSENFGQLDGSVFYSFTDDYKVGVQVTNILNTTTVLDVGYTSYHPRYDWIDTDRKISLIFRAKW